MYTTSCYLGRETADTAGEWETHTIIKCIACIMQWEVYKDPIKYTSLLLVLKKKFWISSSKLFLSQYKFYNKLKNNCLWFIRTHDTPNAGFFSKRVHEVAIFLNCNYLLLGLIYQFKFDVCVILRILNFSEYFVALIRRVYFKITQIVGYPTERLTACAASICFGFRHFDWVFLTHNTLKRIRPLKNLYIHIQPLRHSSHDISPYK